MNHFFKSTIKSSEITPEQVYLSRRKLLKVGGAGLGAMAAMGTLAACSGAATPTAKPAQAPSGQTAVPDVAPVAKAAADELGNKLNSYKEITNYNNYYEFSTDKEEVAVLAANYAPPAPFKVEVTGLVGKAMTFDLDDLKKKFGEEERVYRLRCVEGWSMVIPWMGFSLAGLLKAVEPTSAAKFVRFYSHHDSNMPGNSLDWPYVEGLRLDEAMNELSLMATGLYGKALPVQNGAPVRLALPWKYGFKSIKAVTKVELVAEQPVNTWKAANAGEYGFYSNVNPNRPHPRWTQANERRIGESGRRATLLFNGYEKQVAGLYAGMDLVQEY